jgi:hypothetical protein
MKRDLLKEAIADAKAVKETAIANAKVALEEAFSPKLREMFAEKMDALDEEDAMYEGAEKMDEDELNLEEILAELEGLEETEEMEEAKDMDNMEEAEELTEAEEEEEEEFDIENMSEEDLKSFIESVVDEMITSGELEAGEESEEEVGDMEDMDDMENMESEEEEEMINIDELLAEMQDDSLEEAEELEEAENLNEMSENAMAIMAALSAIGLVPVAYATAKGHEMAKAGKFGDKVKKAVEKFEKVAAGSSAGTTGGGDLPEAKTEELKEAYDAIEQLKKELNTINLLNAKLLYTNKIFKAKNLSENQKVKVLSTFDKAGSVKEVKLVYESLVNSLTEKKKAPIKESLGFASKATGKKESTEKPIIAEDKMVTRFQKLAGIIK